jgi:colanic acid/amylovoran biosynthesis glycosyltransferase
VDDRVTLNNHDVPTVRMRICIAYPQQNVPSETFIRAHVDKLPGEKLILTDGYFPTRVAGKPLLPGLLGFVHRHQRYLFEPFSSYATKIPVLALARFLKRRKIDVVLAEYGVTASEITEACERAGVPLVAHFHGFDAYQHHVLKVRGNYRDMFKYSSALISVSLRMCEQLKLLGAPESKIFYVPYGIDLKVFEQTNPALIPPIFLAVGRFVDKKAPYLTVLAFGEALQKCPNIRLIMAGDGPLLESSKQLARSIGISDAIEFLGVVEHTRVAELMKRSRVFVQHSITPSHGDSEGTPVALLEAAASGLPVISTDHAGIPEAVLNGRTGLLVREGDISGMACHMTTLAQDPLRAQELGNRAREHVSHNYASERCIFRLSAILQWVASRHDAQGPPARMPEWWAKGPYE